jgi:hypothetical protein
MDDNLHLSRFIINNDSSRPIINVILGVDGMISLYLVTDCSGEDKTMEFICDLVSKVIEDLGPTNIFSMVMDGSCKGDFPLIRSKYHHIQCFTCPTHGIHDYIKNICTIKEEIGTQKNDMTGVGAQNVKWDEDFFEKVFSVT